MKGDLGASDFVAIFIPPFLEQRTSIQLEPYDIVLLGLFISVSIIQC